MPNAFQRQVVTWHVGRFPDATREQVALKACEEVGEVARAINGRGDLVTEAADAVICLMALVGRFSDVDLLNATKDRFEFVTDPANGHRAAKDS
jgi:NTP pyrophosphatase (non-canonical NTP hydrolase)